MSKVSIAITTTSVSLPSGVKAGKMRISLFQDGELLDFKDVTGSSAEFDAVAEGYYTATAQRLDDTGNTLGGAVSESFTVSDGSDEMYEAPTGLAVTVTAD